MPCSDFISDPLSLRLISIIATNYKYIISNRVNKLDPASVEFLAESFFQGLLF